MGLGAVPADIAAVAVPIPRIGAVNVWLLKGDPLTLVDTGPASDESLAGLERGLAEHGLGIRDIEQVLVTHQHLDHAGAAAAIQARSGADVAVHTDLADYGANCQERIEAERRYTARLMGRHGVPADLIDSSEGYWDYIATHTEAFQADRVLHDGDSVRAGGRSLRVVHRPGHSGTDTLFVDDAAALAFVGDHLLAHTSSLAQIEPPAVATDRRPRALRRYLANMRLTAEQDLGLGLAGHGPPVTDHARMIAERLSFHERRAERLTEFLEGGPQTVFELARRLFGDTTARKEPVHVVWEVLGHLDLLVADASVTERDAADGGREFCASAPQT